MTTDASKTSSDSNPDSAQQPDPGLIEAIQFRRSPRSFTDQSVAPETLRLLFEAARWSASCFNEQPWRFVYARREDSADFARLAACLVEFNRSWAANAPVLLLSCVTTHFEKNGKPNRHAEHDLGLALGNLSLQAASLGLQIHEMAGFDPERAVTELGLPAGVVPLTVATIGYPGDPAQLDEALRAKESAPRTRKPLSEFVFQNTYGQP